MALRRWPVALVGLLLLGAAGCSDDASKGDPDPTPSVTAPSPTASKTPDEPVEPEPPAAMDREDEAGASAFVEYYWDVVNYAQATGDVSRLKELAFPTCSQCQGGLEWVEDLYGSGGSAKGGKYAVDVRSVQKLSDVEGASTSFRVAIRLSATKQRVLDKKGKVVERHSGAPRSMALVVGLDSETTWRVALWEDLS